MGGGPGGGGGGAGAGAAPELPPPPPPHAANTAVQVMAIKTECSARICLPMADPLNRSLLSIDRTISAFADGLQGESRKYSIQVFDSSIRSKCSRNAE